jgi:predicted transcriptional regulator
MGRLPTGNRKYNIKEMWDCHHEVVRLALLGLKHVDIANTLGVTPVMVSYTLNSPIVKRQLAIMRGARDAEAVDVAAQIKALAPKAVEVLEGLLESESEGMKFKAATGVLDRAGHAPVQRLQASMAVGHFTADEIAEIKNRAKDIIDIDAEVLQLEAPNG